MTLLRKLVDRQGLPFWLNDNGGFRTGVEIGTYRGEYAEHLLTHWAGVLYCVDPWANLPKEEYLDGCVIDHSNMTPLNMDLIYADAKARLTKFGARVQLFRGTGDQFAAQHLQSVDFVYIDGNHDREHVTRDIETWWPRIRSGGVLGGHDFYVRDDHLQRADVLNAVWDFSERIKTRPHVTACTSWWFIKP